MTQPTDPSPDPLVNMLEFTFNESDVFVLIGVLLLLGASALFSGAEVAFFSLSSTEREQLRKGSSRKAKIAERLLEKPKELLATILIAKNFLNVAFVVLAGYLLTKLFVSMQLNFWAIQGINIILITLFLLFGGELYPKTLAFKNKAAFARSMSFYVYAFYITPPFSWLKIPIGKSSNLLERRAKRRGIKISPDTLETVLTLSQNSSDSNEDYTLLHGVLKFGNTDVKQIMCPRMDVVGIEVSKSLEDVIKIFIDAGYSRMPVYRENFDEVVGIIFLKDLIPYLSLGNEFDWNTLIREPFYVPENKKIDDLFKDFKTKKVHIAIVLDEYGGSIGIVTMEDVLEEIVGEIADEFDEDDTTFTQINSSTYVFEGATSLSDFYKAIGIDGVEFEDLKDDAESIGGFIIEQAGKIPDVNETFTVGNIQLTVEEADKKRVSIVRVVVAP